MQKKLIKVQPAIMQESMMIGQQWGQNIAREVLEKYKAQANNKPQTPQNLQVQ